MKNGIVIGYDPGGEGNNGVAVIAVESNKIVSAEVVTADNAEDAFKWYSRDKNLPIIVAGIDTLLSWSPQKNGWRPMDKYLKKTYPKVQNSVATSNSLYGAMAVQGMAMAIMLKESWEDIILNETHPKVHYYAQSKATYKFGDSMNRWLREKIDFKACPTPSNDHEWNALYSAYITLEVLRGKEHTDLMTKIKTEDSIIHPAGTVNYYWLA